MIFIIIIAIIISIYFFRKNSDTNKNNYISSRASINEQSNSENSINSTDSIDNISNETTSSENNSSQNNNNNNVIEINKNDTETKPKVEQEISSFSTKIYNKENNRQNNVSITCSILNGTIVANGSTFSFCNTFGPATPSQGYQKADAFDKDGNKIKEFGGGKCQVSTTLYNAVLKVPSLVVTERHPHSNKVPYIQTGKDAAVSYGSYDLKFRNDTGFDIKIKAENNANNIIITLYKLV